MKKQTISLLRMGWLFAGLAAVGYLTSCGTDDPDPSGEAPIASFQYEVSTTNFLEVTFTSFSQNAASQSWAFGDGNTSTDESPVHTYTEAGTYTVVLTVTGTDGTTADQSRTITLTDPNSAAQALAGTGSKVWQLIADPSTGVFALEVGPEDRSQIWWSFGGAEQLCVRPCLMNDTWTFNNDGTFDYDNQGDFWGEGGIFAAELVGTCFDATNAANWVGAEGQDLTGWNSGSHGYTYDVTAGTLTIDGGFIGIAKAATDSEVTAPQSSVTYKVVKLVDADVDTLVLETTIPAPGYWKAVLVSYDNPNDKIVIGECAAVEAADVTFKVNMNDYANSFTQVYVSGSFNGWSGDGWPMDDTDGDGVWTLTKEIAVGEHEYKFTLDNWAAQEEFTDGTSCTITKDGFVNRYLNVSGPTNVGPYCFNSCSNCPVVVTLADIQGKTYKIPAEPGALFVGPGIGDPSWYSIDQGWIDAGLCLFDDTFAFGTGGVYTVNVGAEMFTEGYMEGIDANGCVAVANVPSNLTPWAGGTFTYSLTEGVDGANPKLTVTGNGAYIGFYKGANGLEPNQPSAVTAGSVTYEIIAFSANSMTVSVDISAAQDRSAAWSVKLVTQ